VPVGTLEEVRDRVDAVVGFVAVERLGVDDHDAARW
jgi:hypothetical protein